MPDQTASNSELIAVLREARSRELRASQLYRLLGDRERDPNRRRLFLQLAEAEQSHAQQFGARLVAVGGALPPDDEPLSFADRLLTSTLGTEAVLRRMEAEEEQTITAFGAHAAAIEGDPEARALFAEIEAEEETHSRLLQAILPSNTPASRL